MKLNRSLAISSKIQECKSGDILGMLSAEYPSSILEEEFGTATKRKRVFTANNTLLTMVLTAIQQDKTLKNSVDLFYIVHQQRQQAVLKELEQALEKEKAFDAQKAKTAGRPKHL